jgi:uncharacterized protein DUF4439
MTTPSAADTPAAQVTGALQSVLAAEHAAVFSYAQLGTVLTDQAQIDQARQLQAQHRAARDQAMAVLANRGATPVPAQASYAPPAKLSSPKDAQDWALSLEDACAQAYRYVLVAASRVADEAALRAGTLRNLINSAGQSLYWRQLLTPATPTVPFPGT